MNRKERRTAKRLGTSRAHGPAANGAPAGAAAELFQAAVAYHHAGALVEAERRYRQVLAILPDHAEAHSRLGAVMMRQGKTADAIGHIERAVALQPETFEAHGNLAQAYMWTGQRERAIDAATRALELKDTPQTRAMFGQCVCLARFTTDDGRYRRWVLRALVEGWVRPRELAGVSVSLIKIGRAIREAIARIEAAWPARLPAGELLDDAGMSALAGDELLCRLLECDPIADVSLERLLTSVRCAALTGAAYAGACDDSLLGFYCSIARQCFINEYIFSTTAAEAEDAQRLRTALEAKLAAGEPCPALVPAIVGAYFPLHAIANAQMLLTRTWPPSVKELLVKQVAEPAEESRIAPTIAVLTAIEDEVSRAVRRQYEENPYPRWNRLGPPAQPAILFGLPPQHLRDALIAGCGTGLSTIEFACHARSARILAIDLSLTSLSYAKRTAEQAGLTNVEFAHADIMKLASLDRRFDFIDASGVLHHLADPWEGWRILLALLRPGGAMQVGLYSELARRNVVAARRLIAERGYRAVPDDIRRCRQDIVASADPLLKSVSRTNDFFTVSECRDLLFHVHERRTTLPEIKSFLAANRLEFRGFFLDALAHSRFAARFPGGAAGLDLDCWHAFETEAPDTFGAMYQFSLRKPH